VPPDPPTWLSWPVVTVELEMSPPVATAPAPDASHGVHVDLLVEVAAVGVDLLVHRVVGGRAATVHVVVGDVAVEVPDRGLMLAPAAVLNGSRGRRQVDRVVAALAVAAGVGGLAVLVQDQGVVHVAGVEVAQAVIGEGGLGSLANQFRSVVQVSNCRRNSSRDMFGVTSWVMVWISGLVGELAPAACRARYRRYAPGALGSSGICPRTEKSLGDLPHGRSLNPLRPITFNQLPAESAYGGTVLT